MTKDFRSLLCMGHLLFACGYGVGQTPDFGAVPGHVVNHVPASSGVFLGAPSIARDPDGAYFVSHNFTSIEQGDRGDVHKTAIFKSVDNGTSWTKMTEIDHQRWSTLFYHRGAYYLIGTDKAFGNAVIRKSTNGCNTWTTPLDGNTGLIAEGRYHCAPVPVVEHNGRLWRAMEDAPKGREFRALLLSVPVDADLLDAGNWVLSEKLPYDETWLEGRMRGWLEGNAVVAPDGNIVNILRCGWREGLHSRAAVIRYDQDGKIPEFDPQKDFIQLPGGTKKFTIRYDHVSGKYWSLVNWIQPVDLGLLHARSASGIRNCLALVSSKDVRNWIVEKVILYHEDVDKHAFQYADWIFEGKDILVAARTAFDDGLGGAANFHDANFITFHRIVDFRRNHNDR